MTKNLKFPRFMVVFMSYYPQFYGSKVTYINFKTRYIFDSNEQKLASFVFYDCFHELLPTLQGSMPICMVHNNTPYMSEKNDKKIVVFTFYGRFDELLP